jgi:hypothetical protein
MTSQNFEFLRPHRAELADLGAFAERYAYPDPVSSLVKLRSLAEALTWEVYRLLSLERPVPDDFVNLLTSWQFKTATPRIVQDQLHAIRKAGNRAAHGNQATAQSAASLMQDAYHLAAWFASQFHKVPKASARPCAPCYTDDVRGGYSSVGRALDCGSRCRGFKSHYPPHLLPSALHLFQTLIGLSPLGQIEFPCLAFEFRLGGAPPLGETALLEFLEQAKFA